MVKYNINLDAIFSSLADPTRRDILKHVCQQSLSISKIAEPYTMSFAAIAKHVRILKSAQLITKQRKGKQQIIKASSQAIQAAATHLEMYHAMWDERFSSLDNYFNHSK